MNKTALLKAKRPKGSYDKEYKAWKMSALQCNYDVT